jgi:hypothetical protein
MTRRITDVLAGVALVGCALVTVAGPASAATTRTRAGRSVPSATAGLRPLTIQTVPAVVGARFVLDGRLLVTGTDGTVRTLTTKALRDALTTNQADHLSVASPTIVIRSGVRAKFAGWYAGGYHYSSANKTGQLLRAAFNFDYLTSFSFARPNGTSVTPQGLRGIELHASAGGTVTLPSAAPVWLRGIRVSSAAGHLQVTEVNYKIAAVTVRGDNVVHADQQRFVPSHQPHVVVELLLFTVQLKTRDALFKHGSGSAVVLKFVDGTTQWLPIHNGSVTFTDLPRGDYAMTVYAPGLTSAKALSISRDQTATIQIISWLDVTVAVVALLALTAALILVARSRRHGRLASRTRVVDRPVNLQERRPEPTAQVR